MAVPAVIPNYTRVDAADGGSSFANIGGGPGAGGETDIVWQGSGATPEDISRRIGTSEGGFAITGVFADASTATGTYQTFIAKIAAGNFFATSDLHLRYGSGSAAYCRYDVLTGATYPKKGGFVLFAINPNIVGYRTSTQGSPDLANMDYFGLAGSFTSASKVENGVKSCVDIGNGLRLTGGGNGDQLATYNDFSVFDTEDITSSPGFVTKLEGLDGFFGVYGTLDIDSDNFEAIGDTLIFFDGFYEQGWSGVIVRNSVVGRTYVSRNITFDSRGNTSVTDTRGVYTIDQTSNAYVEENPTFKNWREINMNSSLTIQRGNIQVFLIDQNGGTIENATISTTSNTGVATLANPDFTLLSNTTFIQNGTGHAIELQEGIGNVSLTGLTFNGYGADGTNNSAINYTGTTPITLSFNGGTEPTVTGDITVLQNQASLSFTVLDADNNDAPIENARIEVLNSSTKTRLIQPIETNASGLATASIPYSSDINIEGWARQVDLIGEDYAPEDYNGVITQNGFSTIIRLNRIN